jgi:hypothetical protein
LATRDEDVGSERVVLGTHRFQDGLRFPNRVAKVFQNVLEPICLHNVQSNISAEKDQILVALRAAKSRMNRRNYLGVVTLLSFQQSLVLACQVLR